LARRPFASLAAPSRSNPGRIFNARCRRLRWAKIARALSPQPSQALQPGEKPLRDEKGRQQLIREYQIRQRILGLLSSKDRKDTIFFRYVLNGVDHLNYTVTIMTQVPEGLKMGTQLVLDAGSGMTFEVRNITKGEKGTQLILHRTKPDGNGNSLPRRVG